MLKKLVWILIFLILPHASTPAVETTTLQTGISIIDRVPKEFFGTWRVKSEINITNAESLFKKNSTDLWNLSKSDNVITLSNPFTGAKASITLSEVDSNLIKFKKQSDYDGKKLTDIVQLRLDKNTFSGTNTIILETLSDVDGTVIKNERATYKITGEKISGSSIKEEK